MTGQPRVARLLGAEPLLLQHLGNGLHHQLMLMAILDGMQQHFGRFLLGSSPSQGIATQLTLPDSQQSFRRCPHQITPISQPPKEAATAPLLLPQAAEQQLRIQRRAELQLLTHRQHQLAQLVLADQLKGLIDSPPISPMPGTTAQQLGNLDG